VGVDQQIGLDDKIGIKSNSGVDYFKMQMLLKRLEIPLVVEQLIAFMNTEGRRKAINCIAYCDASAAQRAIAIGGLNRQVAAFSMEESKMPKLSQCFREWVVAPDALQNFGENE